MPVGDTARLAPGKGYYVRYNPADLSDTLYVYQGEKLLCEAKKVELTGFNDKAAAKSILKLRRNYIKKVKEQAAALQELKAADTPAFMAGLRAEVMGEQVDPETGEILPAGKVVNTGKTLPLPKVLAMVNTVADAPGGPKSSEQLEREKEKAEVEELRKTQPESSVFDRALGRKRVGR